MILDGWGCGDHKKDDVIFNTPTPYWDSLLANYPHSQLQASGENVGLPDGQMGNSEVGHLNIGAGRIVYQDLVKINRACADNSIMQNKEVVSAFSYAKENGKNIHFMGLTSNGGVHSSFDHLFKLCDIAQEYGLNGRTFIHCFMDGRDVPPSSGKDFIVELQEKMQEIGVGEIATISGRYYAMDRDHNWDRVQKAYDAMVNGKGNQCPCAKQAMEDSYAAEVTDEFVVPTVINKDGMVHSGDSVIFFNFRPDRAREITRTFVDPAFDGFAREKLDVYFVCFTQYDATMPNVEIAFKPQSLKNTFGEYVSEHGLTQLRIAETEKYAHVTFFFNGGVEKQYPGESRILVDSPKEVATYDQKPSMSAYEVAVKAINAINADTLDVIILNFANCDMVGHTGVFDAAKAAVEAVDTCVGSVVKAVTDHGGVALITADHGNADKMYEADGSPFTAHTTNVVPFIVVGRNDVKLREGGVLADIAPTMLKLLNMEQPEEMTGKSIIL